MSYLMISLLVLHKKLAKQSHNDYDLCRNTEKELDKDIPYG